MSLLCRFGIHRRYRPGRVLWLCQGCPGIWKRHHDDRGLNWRWEKV